MSFETSVKTMPCIHFAVVWAQVADPLKTPNAPLSLLKVPSRCADHRRKRKEKLKNSAETCRNTLMFSKVRDRIQRNQEVTKGCIGIWCIFPGWPGNTPPASHDLMKHEAEIILINLLMFCAYSNKPLNSF